MLEQQIQIRLQNIPPFGSGLILKDDPDWPADKIESAMNGGKETTCMLKRKIPVYIGYFTCWVQEDGEIHFYPDVYGRDESLDKLLYSSDALTMKD